MQLCTADVNSSGFTSLPPDTGSHLSHCWLLSVSFFLLTLTNYFSTLQPQLQPSHWLTDCHLVCIYSLTLPPKHRWRNNHNEDYPSLYVYTLFWVLYLPFWGSEFCWRRRCIQAQPHKIQRTLNYYCRVSEQQVNLEFGFWPRWKWKNWTCAASPSFSQSWKQK